MIDAAEATAPYADDDDGAGSIAARQHWLAVLAKASLADLERAWNALPHQPLYRTLRPSETGLVMVRGRIGGTGQPFNFGEMTMTRAAIQLVDAAGAVTYTGFGYIAGCSAKRAELVALFDALLQDPERQDELATSVVDVLAARQAAEKAAGADKFAATKVDFFTMVRGE
jgi:alpha-D-ribose 1-methylphosphonate 5-triphosphate synthase subunit PhnG